MFHARPPTKVQSEFGVIASLERSASEVCDALDQPGDFLVRGSAFWDCGIHVGIHFRMGGLQHADESR